MIDFILLFLLLLLILLLVLGMGIVWGILAYRVPLVPTSQKVVRTMIRLADLKPGQKAYDLGCGMGTILFVLPHGIQGVGYDIVRPAIWFTRLKNIFLRKNIRFECANFFHKNLSDADVLFCYLFPSVMERLHREKWSELKSGCQIISHGFSIPNISPKKTIQEGKSKIYIYQK